MLSISSKPGIDTSIMVVDLINGQGEWEEVLLAEIGTMQEVEAILHIPLIRSSLCDRLIWNFNRHGKYTVKSGYWLALKERDLGSRVGNCDPVVIEYWRHLWKLKVPPKMLHFLWRCSNGFIPCMDALYQKRVVHEATCSRCRLYHETPLHATWQCKDCVAVLEGASFYPKLTTRQVSSFSDLFSHAVDVLTVDELKMLVVLLWSNWNERNAIVHGAQPRPPTVIFESCLLVWKGILEVQSMVTMGRSGQDVSVGRDDVRWCPPLPGVLKLNCDGSVSINREQVGVGAVIRNEFGSFIGAVGQRVNQRLDPYTRELFAIKVGLEFALEQGLQAVVVETDCLEAVTVVNATEECLGAAGIVVEEIRRLMRCFTALSIIHIPREANKAAHEITTFVAREIGRLSWLGDGPSWLVHVINNDAPITLNPIREVSCDVNVHNRSISQV